MGIIALAFGFLLISCGGGNEDYELVEGERRFTDDEPDIAEIFATPDADSEDIELVEVEQRLADDEPDITDIITFRYGCPPRTPEDQNTPPPIYLLPIRAGVGIDRSLQMAIYPHVSSVWEIDALSPSIAQWYSCDDSIATVDQLGEVKGVSEGTVEIVAVERLTSFPDRDGPEWTIRSVISVSEAVASLEVPSTLSMLTDCTASIESRPVSRAGAALEDRPVRWVSDAPDVVRIVQAWPQGISAIAEAQALLLQHQAILFGASAGTTTVTSVSEGIAATTYVRVVEGTPATTRVIPSELIVDVGEIKDVEIVIHNQGGCVVSNAAIAWETNDPSIATVSGSGLNARVEGTGPGTTTITATTQNGLVEDIIVTILPVASISLSPSPFPELDINSTREIHTTLRAANGTVLHNREVTWAIVGNAAILEIGGASDWNRVKGISVGEATVTAISEGVSASILVRVPVVASISLSPSPFPELDINSTREIHTTLRSATGTILHNREVTWTIVGNAAILEIGGASDWNRVKGISVGEATVTATSEGVSASILVRVPAVARIDISPSSATLSVGDSATFSATPRSAQGTPLYNRQVTWTTSNNRISVQQISGTNKGIVTANSSGDSSVIASSEGKTGSASVYVKTYCEDNVCASRYRLENYTYNYYDVYYSMCNNSGCSGWIFQITMGPETYYNSPLLTENTTYVVRVVVLGGDAYIWNDIKMATWPFVGGPGIVATYRIYD